MKAIDAKCPGVVTLITEGHNNDYLARRDFVDTFNSIRIELFKESMKTKEQSWNPVLHAGLLFFKELGITGYKLETSLNRNIKTGLNLLEDEVLEAASLKAMNQLLETKLSVEELQELGRQISPRIPSIICNEPVIVNQNEEIIKPASESKDSFYNLILLSDLYKDIDLTNFFIDEEVDLDKEDERYKELLAIKRIMEANKAKNMSMNGYSNVVISSYNDIHDRFQAYKELKERQYQVTQLNRSNGITMIKLYK